jgi:hypothetical protein
LTCTTAELSPHLSPSLIIKNALKLATARIATVLPPAQKQAAPEALPADTRARSSRSATDAYFGTPAPARQDQDAATDSGLAVPVEAQEIGGAALAALLLTFAGLDDGAADNARQAALRLS